MLATQPETMLLAEAMRTRGLCVSIVQLPQRVKAMACAQPVRMLLMEDEAGKPRWVGVPQADRRHGGGGGPWGRWVSAGTVEHTGTCNMSETGEQ